MEAFKFTTIKNCRRYTKRCYTLSRMADEELVSRFENFGILEMNYFSKYSALAKDTFKIRFDDQIEVSGTLDSESMYVTISKEHHELEETVEAEINEWFSSTAKTN